MPAPARAKSPPSTKLKTGRGHDADEWDALDLLEWVEQVARVFHDMRGPIGVRNERWTAGDQWDDVQVDSSITWGEWDPKLPKFDHNLLNNRSLHYVALLLESLPVTAYWPKSADPESVSIANSCNRILEHYNQALSRHLKLKEALLSTLNFGAAGLKPYYDPNRGVFGDYDTPQGDVALDVVSFLEYATDGAKEVKDSKWGYFTRFIDCHDAYEMMRRAGYSEEEAAGDTLKGRGEGDSDEGEPVAAYADHIDGASKVRATEIWHKPCVRYPEGLFLSFIGRKLVSNREFLYDHDEVPLAIIRLQKLRGLPFGYTPVDGAVKIQRMYNEVLSVRTRRFYEFRNNYLVTDPHIAKQLRAGNLVLTRQDTAEGDRPAESIEVVNLDPGVEGFAGVLEQIGEMMDGQYGIPEMSMGVGVGQSTPGKTLSYQQFLAKMKTAMTTDIINEANARVDRQILELVQQYFDVDRLMMILGPGSEGAAIAFLGADLDGFDVLPQPASGQALSRAARGDEAANQVAAGSLDPATGSELAATGLLQTQDEAWMVQQVGEAASEALATGSASPPDGLDPAVAVRELRRLVMAYDQHPHVDVLVQMLQYFEAQGAQAAPSQAAMPGQQQPSPAMPGPAEEVFQ